ncbi:DUF1499 domain-containing protein [Alkalicoccus luteus]|uniref:DUF1499 domain-containing protein n=1 Tax=Alkalicoccus luteus TaxID=1237094 RepID=UPI0040345949
MRIIVIVVIAGIIAAAAFMVIKNNRTPEHLGAENGSLAPLPSTPNAVSSQADTEHRGYIEPFTLQNGTESLENIKAIIRADEQAEIVSADDRYVHAVYASNVFKFKDDVEFYVNESENSIDVRSAARVGYSDMDVNRKRIEAIREAYQSKHE